MSTNRSIALFLSIALMLHKFSPDLSTHSIYAQGNELATMMSQDKDKQENRVYTYPKEKTLHVIDLPNPVLVTDRYKINQIQEYIKRETVHALFESPFITVDYDDVQMDFEKFKYPGVWSPSIDTLFFCRALKGWDFKDYSSMIEVGSGPWFIAKYIGEKNSNLEKIVLNDINENAEKYFYDHYTDKRFFFYLGDAKEYMENQKFDVIASNPPYIPRPQSIDDNPYEGLSLPIYLIQNIDKILSDNGKLFLNLSSLSFPIMDEFLENPELQVKKLDSIEVPLKVFNVLNNPEWMDYLIKKKWLKKEYHNGHEYRQTLYIYEIQKKK